MILTKKKQVLYFQFPGLSRFREIKHGIFTRNSGHSKGLYQSLNINYNSSDNKNDIKLNRDLVSRCMNEDKNNIVYAGQVHGTNVLLFSENNNKTASDTAGKLPPEGDALVSNVRKKMLVIMLADCQPVFLYEPVRRVVANIHSGWRGSINNIIGRTIYKMNERFGCNPEKIIAGIGPSLGPCCAEFVNYKKEIPEAFWKYKDNADYFDFWALSRDQLIKAGVSAENINLSRICTRCNSDIFFSYRRERLQGGSRLS